jgi:hypothetical protein
MSTLRKNDYAPSRTIFEGGNMVSKLLYKKKNIVMKHENFVTRHWIHIGLSLHTNYIE